MSSLPQNAALQHYPALQEKLIYCGCTALITCIFLQNKQQTQNWNWRLRAENEAEETNIGLGGDAHFKHSSVKVLISQICFPWNKNSSRNSGETNITFLDQIQNAFMFGASWPQQSHGYGCHSFLAEDTKYQGFRIPGNLRTQNSQIFLTSEIKSNASSHKYRR